jgi:hypothetical protein
MGTAISGRHNSYRKPHSPLNSERPGLGYSVYSWADRRRYGRAIGLLEDAIMHLLESGETDAAQFLTDHFSSYFLNLKMRPNLKTAGKAGLRAFSK